ncbi:MAG: HD domain-containing protein, partial [Planctomycetota bacterium]
MKQKKWKIFRDPIHKDIYLSPEELAIVDTPTFQRLRGIKELGAAYWVYPSALHSRFEHSLGVLHTVKKILHHMEIIHSISLSDEEKMLVRLYGLLHDISHIPFGHTLEDERRLFPRHDEDEARIQFFLEQKDLSQAIHQTGLEEPLKRMLIKGESRPSYLTEIVSATIGADMMDYLRRDTYFCGLTLDYDDRILRSFTLEDGRLVFNLSKEGMIRADVLSELVHLLHMRYILTERVYFHHAKIAASIILCKAVELAIQEGLQKKDILNLEDSSFLFYLSQRFQNHPIIPRLIHDFQSRHLYN